MTPGQYDNLNLFQDDALKRILADDCLKQIPANAYLPGTTDNSLPAITRDGLTRPGSDKCGLVIVVMPPQIVAGEEEAGTCALDTELCIMVLEWPDKNRNTSQGTNITADQAAVALLELFQGWTDQGVMGMLNRAARPILSQPITSRRDPEVVVCDSRTVCLRTCFQPDVRYRCPPAELECAFLPPNGSRQTIKLDFQIPDISATASAPELLPTGEKNVWFTVDGSAPLPGDPNTVQASTLLDDSTQYFDPGPDGKTVVIRWVTGGDGWQLSDVQAKEIFIPSIS